ncbi:MAG: bifunctional 4'-phosphopantothenoylcysteine decarboxylase/phosphopantothenoylcysteine synthetase, partial [Campylobacteraceae bacterium]|nr:bifunctional 4'-phosphopantothenoylcysteine decarboxylase/phosphopantothenoylcysteine synthetase [Campylobacteraceae bacterium]
MNLLENKNILVAVTGSIAVYKTLELIRLYKKAGANVKVIMT